MSRDLAFRTRRCASGSRSTSGTVAGALLVSACASAPYAQLDPVGTDRDRAGAESNGVTLTAEPDAWFGGADVRRYVVPLRLTVSNDANESLFIRYQDIALVGDSGVAYRVLPPFEREGAARRDAEPLFEHEGFLLAPRYASVFPGLTVYTSAWPADAGYHERYDDYWAFEPLPTPEMLDLALPEGVLEPGGEVAGFVYFERLDAEDGDRLTLTARLIAADDRPLAEFALPFEVERE